MASRHSSGILLYRWSRGGPEVLIAHMGGPFWQHKDQRAWSFPKGEHDPDDDPFEVACREFAEELGVSVPATDFTDLGTVTQRGGKRVRVWAAAGDLDASAVVSNTVTVEWPRGSGRWHEFPEIDRAAWCDLDTARGKLVAAQVAFLDRLAAVLGVAHAPPSD